MNKRYLTRKIVAGVLYICGILFVLFIGMIIFNGSTDLDAVGFIISTICFCIPIALATFILMPTMNGITEKVKTMKIFVSIVFAFYIMLLINILLYSDSRHIMYAGTMLSADYIKMDVNLIPFKTIVGYIKDFTNDSLSKSIIIQNLLGNVLLFSPMGILLPSLFKRLHKFKSFLIALLVILIGTEMIQLLTGSGICDIDDVILNSIGALLLYGLWKTHIAQKILRKMYILRTD